MNPRIALVLCILLFTGIIFAQAPPQASQGPDDRPRVFITDSHSWEVGGSSGGAGGVFGGTGSGGARPQTAEIVKTFGEKCPSTVPNNIQAKANYIVVLDHEGGKGWLAHKNKVAVFDARSGDSVISKSTLSLGGSVDEACKGIMTHWATHRSAPGVDPALQQQTAAASDPRPAACRLMVSSLPDGADIEVDGSFVGNTPSALELATGDHTIAVKKSGYKTWQRKMRASTGDINLKAELEKGND